MAVPAIFRRGPPTRAGIRPFGRPSVIAWAVAATAAIAATASVFTQGGPAAFALVTRVADKPHAAIDVVPDPVPPAAQPLIDPRSFRKPAPPADGRPRVAIVISGLGLSAAATARAIGELPAEISLSFSPYGRSLQKQADGARADGHEIFVDIPLEPIGFPGNDSGPQAILSALSPGENAERLRWSLARFTGYAGLTVSGESPVLDEPKTLAPLFSGPSAEALVWVHPDAAGFKAAPIDSAEFAFAIDTIAEESAIDAALTRLEGIARSRGSVLAVAHAYPITIQRVAAWSKGVSARGLALVPASSLARSPESAARTAYAGPESGTAHSTTAEGEPAHADPEPAHAPASEEHAAPVSESHGEHH